MSQIISASICLSKIDKEKITTGKDGNKYLNLTISVNDEKNQFDQDVSICHEQSKEERERKDKRVYLGNGKIVWRSQPNVAAPSTTTETPVSYSNKKDDLPF